ILLLVRCGEFSRRGGLIKAVGKGMSAKAFNFGELFLALEVLIEWLERQAIFLPAIVGSIATAFSQRQGTVGSAKTLWYYLPPARRRNGRGPGPAGDAPNGHRPGGLAGLAAGRKRSPV